MQYTLFEPDKQMIAALAHGYLLHDGMADPKPAAADLKTGRGYKMPNRAVFTTVGDLARFVSFELGYGPEILLTREALRESQSQMFWTDEAATNGYGLGFMLVRKGTIEGHGFEPQFIFGLLGELEANAQK